MKLYATPLSHFSRKVRILLDLYHAPYELIDVGNLTDGGMEKFGNNPLSRVPVLIDGSVWLTESDTIGGFIVDKYDAEDKYQVRSRVYADLNTRAILSGIMAEEVTLLIAQRTSIPTESYRFFDDALDAIRNGLRWLECQADQFGAVNPK